MLDERRRLRRATARDQTAIARLRGIMRLQVDSIRELQEDVAMEQGRTNALREQLQVVNDRLTRVVREVRDRSRGIIDECEALKQGVIGANAQVEAQGDGATREGDVLVLAMRGSPLA